MNSILHCALNKKYNKNPDGSRDLLLPPLKDNCHKLFPFFGNLSLTIIVVGSQRQCFTSPLWKREAERSSQRFCSPSNQKLAVFSTGTSGTFLIAEFVKIDLTHQRFCPFLVYKSQPSLCFSLKSNFKNV